MKFNNYDSYSYSFQHWFISTGCNENEYNVDIKLILFEICLIHMPILLIQIHKFRKIITVLINDSKWFEWFESFINIYIHSCCCIYKESRKKKTKTASKANTHNLLLSIVEFVCESYYMLCFVYMSIYEELKSTTSLSTFTIIVVVVFTKKEERKKKQRQQTKETPTTFYWVL